MVPRWLDSARKRGIPEADQAWAIIHASYRSELPDESLDDGTVWLYIGNPHPQTEREIEILVNVYPDQRESVVFHAMPLGPKFRRFREENPRD